MNRMEAEHNALAYDETLRAHDAQEQAYRAERKEWEHKNPYCWKGNAAKCPADPAGPPPETGPGAWAPSAQPDG